MEPSRNRRNNLYDFLDKNCLVSKGSEFTHTSIYDPTASYYVPPNLMDKFFELYKTSVQNDADLYLTEKHRDIGPIVIDLDFRFELNEQGNAERVYNNNDILNIVKVYTDALTPYVEDISVFNVYVMEKPNPVVNKGLLKDGIHIVIPDIVTRPMFQLMLREHVIPKLDECLKHLNMKNKITDVVDEAVIERNNWQMYGSKKPHLDKYTVTHVYEYNTSTKTIEELNVSTNQADYVELLSIRNKFMETKIKFEKQEDVKKYEELINRRKMQNHLKNCILSKTKNVRMNTNEEFELAKTLMELLSEERADNYNDWIRVGWCVRNIDHRLLDKWIEFSKKSRKFVEGECEKYWNYMRQDGACLGMGTLHLWAKNDSPERYAEIVQSELRELIRQARSGTEYDVARVLEKMNNHLFKYDTRNKLWYMFKNHRWHLTPDGMALKRKLPTEMIDEFRKSIAFYAQRASTTADAEEKERFDALVTELGTIVKKLKRASFQQSVIQEAQMLFSLDEDRIEEKMDSNTHLIGFENGVYDLDAMEFRDGRPEDYISLSTGINYIPYDENNPFIRDIQNFLDQILPSVIVKEYVLRLFASFLHGSIREERFHVWTGSGCFAKDTPVLMYNGDVKPIQDIMVGDILMGDDSTPRNVKELFRGFSDMYEVKPARGDSFRVNGDHDMQVVATNTVRCHKKRGKIVVKWIEYVDDKVTPLKYCSSMLDNIEDAKTFKENLQNNKKMVRKGDKFFINMRQYLNLSKNIQELLNIYRTGVQYPEKEVKLDPYVLGYWLGDGNTHDSAFTTQEPEVAEYIEKVCQNNGAVLNALVEKGNAKSYYVRKAVNGTCKNFMANALNDYGMYKVKNSKHIPKDYLINSEDVRMKVLAGILDSDGSYQSSAKQYELTLKSERLLDDVIDLARSLGFACYKSKINKTCCNNGKVGTYYRAQIVGEKQHLIPTLVPRKKAEKRTCPRDPMMLSFQVLKVPDDNFYGFELDGNHLFVMGKTYTVQKNSNGKSKILELFEKAYGEYCCTLPIALLTQKRGASNSASPELARAKSKRFACLQEPGENERLNIGLMKEMTGGDKLYARGLYKEGSEFKPQFKMILTCNHLPVVPSDDGGTWRRIRVVRFGSKFCENPDPNKPNEFPIDTELSARFDEWKEPFMSMLIEVYKKIVTTKIKEPDEVLECTREYQRRNDIIADFLDNAVEANEGGFLSVTDLFVEFKTWLKEEGVVDRGMRKADFQNYIEKQYGKPIKRKLVKGWVGYRQKSSIADYNMDDEYD